MKIPDELMEGEFSRLTYLVPANTRATLLNHVADCAHLGLLLSRIVPFEAIASAKVISSRNNREKGKWNSYWLHKVIDQVNNSQNLLPLIMAQYERWQALTHAAERFTSPLRGRLIVGLGAKGVLETGITLNQVTGLPYIPGSALKGMTRTYALLIIAENLGIQVQTKLSNDQKRLSVLDELETVLVAEDRVGSQRTCQHEAVRQAKIPDADAYLFRAIFGSQGASGGCIFYDAVVANLGDRQPLFELDVMTQHYRSYYESAQSKQNRIQPPADDDSPNPITFVTVAAETPFAFAIGRRGNTPAEIQLQALEWLKQGLWNLGIGAKTAAGYGVFERTQ